MAVKTFPMRNQRALVAANPLQFGRGPAWLANVAGQPAWGLSDDAKLFATTFAGGFLFVSILIA